MLKTKISKGKLGKFISSSTGTYTAFLKASSFSTIHL